MRSLLLAASLLLPAAAAARPILSLRVAYAPALGSAAAGVPASDALAAQAPLQLDLLWRIRHVAVGLYGSAAPGFWAAGSCDDGADCGGSVLRAGVEAHLALGVPVLGARPWLGAGAGWEWVERSRARLGSETVYGWRGPEAFVEGGLAWRLRGRFTLGPYVLAAAGRYRTLSLETSEDSASAPLDDRAVHYWFHFGVRAGVDL